MDQCCLTFVDWSVGNGNYQILNLRFKLHQCVTEGIVLSQTSFYKTSCLYASFGVQMSEMEISRAVAERSLREHMGNVVEALVALTN